MKAACFLFFFSLLLFSWPSNAQIADTSKAFDFWIGEWEAHWYNSDSNIVKGHNRLEPILEGKVIQEFFTDPSRNFKGTSISVYNSRNKSWHQAWADNKGGYYDFIGLFEDNRRLFCTDTSKLFIQRMVFYNIKEDSFTWDWEYSKDGGENFHLSWRIYYQRITE